MCRHRPNRLLKYWARLESVAINPTLFVEAVERHFTSYIQELRKAKDPDLKRNFEQAIELKWNLGKPGNLVGLSEEQFISGYIPDGA